MVFPGKIFFAFIGCVLLFGTSTAWGCTTDEDCGYPTVYSSCRYGACISLQCGYYYGEDHPCPSGYTCLNGTCRQASGLCFTKTCSNDLTCTAAGYSACTNGCCTGASVSCTTCTCTSDSDCTKAKCSVLGPTGGLCVSGYCVTSGNSNNGVFGSLAACQSRANCATGTSCQQTMSGTYTCLPYCDMGNFYTGGADCGCQSCSAYVVEAYANANLTAFATATTAAGGHDPITSCYIPAGTYYDERGTFSYSSDCYYTE